MKRTSTFSAAGAQPNARGPKCRSMQNISKDNSEKEKPVMTEKNDNEGTPSDSTSVKLSDRPFGELSYEERRQALEEVEENRRKYIECELKYYSEDYDDDDDDNDDGEDAEDGDEETGNAGVRLNGNGEEKTPGKPDNSDGTNPQ